MKTSTRYVIFCTISFWLSIAVVKSESTEAAAGLRARLTGPLEAAYFVVTNALVTEMALTFKQFAPILRPVGTILGGLVFFNGSEENIQPANFKETQSKLDVLSKKVHMVSSQIPAMRISMDYSMYDETSGSQVFKMLASIDDKVRKIKAQPGRLRIIIRASAWLRQASAAGIPTNDTTIISRHESEKQYLLSKLKDFADEITSNPVSSTLVQALEDDPFLKHASLFDELVDYGKKLPQNLWSITTMIFLLHMRVAMYAFQEMAYAEYATVLHGNISGTDFGVAFRQLESRRKQDEENLVIHAHDVGENLRPEHCLETPVLGILPPERIVKLKNFLQVFWETENQLGPNVKSCEKNCSYYSETRIKQNGCSGTVHFCDHDNTTSILSMRYQDPQVDKIYTETFYREPAFFSTERWGSYWNDYTSDGLRHVKNKERGDHWCHICKCVCDQHDSVHTTRRFYKLPIAAQHQHVVTGVRFVEHNRGIFLQIQTGKLKSLGLIDQSTVDWQKLPENPSDNEFVSLTWMERSVLLNNIKSINEKSVVTGFVFNKHLLGVKLQVLKRTIIDWSTGELGDQYAEQPASVENQGNDFDEPLRKAEGLNPQNVAAIDFKHFEAVRYVFGLSGAQDSSQSCLPYFDASNVTFLISVPLSHVKFIRYTNDEEYAGYIRPVLRSLNYNYWYFSNPLNEPKNIKTPV